MGPARLASGDDDGLVGERDGGGAHLEDGRRRLGGPLRGSARRGSLTQQGDLGTDGAGQVRLGPGGEELLPDLRALGGRELQGGVPRGAQGGPLGIGRSAGGRGRRGRLLGGGRSGALTRLGRIHRLHLVAHLHAREELVGGGDAGEGLARLQHLHLSEEETVAHHLSRGGVAGLDDAVDAQPLSGRGGIRAAEIDEGIRALDAQDIRRARRREGGSGQQQKQEEPHHHLSVAHGRGQTPQEEGRMWHCGLRANCWKRTIPLAGLGAAV